MIAENVAYLRRRIAEACRNAGRNPGEITLVGVAKTFPPEAIREAVAAGIGDIGENYAQEFQAKQAALAEMQIRWHFVGHLQSNKVKAVVPAAGLIQAVDSEALGAAIARRAEASGKVAEILVEVNTSGEASKFGVTPEDAIRLVPALSRLAGLRVRGLMTIGPLTEESEAARKAFRLLRTTGERLREAGFPAEILSMGMSGDFEIAIAEGATMLRIGTGIFGRRAPRAAHA